MIWLPVILLLIVYIFINNERKRRKFPPGPWPWPLIGNIYQIDSKNPEKTLNSWRNEYGKIFTIWIPDPLVVLADGELMDITFGKPGETFAGRPHSAIMDLLFKGNYGLMFDENEIYKNQRRFALSTLKNFGFGRNELDPLIIEHAENSLKTEVERSINGVVNTKRIFTVAIARVIQKLVFYEDLPDVDKIMRLKIVIENLFTDWFNPHWMVLESMPWLRYLEKFGIFNFGIQKAAEYNDEFVEFLESQIEHHKEYLKTNSEPRDYADCFLLEMRKGESPDFNPWQMTIACYDLWSAGVETVTCTLQFAVLYLLRHPEIQEKIRVELKTFEQQNLAYTYANLRTLAYYNAFFQEIHRLTNVIPFSLTHEMLEPAEIEGYKFPAGTCVIAQLACFNLNPKHFPEPEKFKPERHLDEQGNLKPDPLLHPFSIGRRSCLGEALARPELLLVLATILRKYRFESIDPENPPPLTFRPGLVKVPDDYDCVMIYDPIFE